MTAPTPPRTLYLATLAAVFFLSVTSLLQAQNTLTETDKERILQRLEEMRELTLKSKFGRYANAMTAFQAAAETPAKSYEFYLECYKLVHFDREGKKFSEYRDWKSENIKKLRATEHATMLQFQLRYLVMTIRALHMEDRSAILPQLSSFISTAVERVDFMGESAGGLRRSVTRSIFAQAYEIDKTLGSDERWEMAPLNIAGHYQKLIFPLLREEGNAKGLERAWDNLITLEIALMEPVEDEKRKDDFVKKFLPRVRWAKWADVAENGERARASNEMLKILEANLDHDNAEVWINDLVETVKGGTISDEDFATGWEDEPAPEATTAPSPAPATAP